MDIASEALTDGIIKINLSGYLDKIGTEQIAPRFHRALETEKRVIVDLEHVKSISPEGIALLLAGAKTLHTRSGRYVLLMPVHDVVTALKSAHTEQTMPMFRDMHEALTAAQA